MSVLSDNQIARELSYRNLDVFPVDMDEQLQPCSLDIRLGDEFAEYDTNRNEATLYIDSSEQIPESCVERTEIKDKIWIYPDDFYLANTKEYIEIPSYLGAEVRGRSSIGRLGLEVHSTAGWIDAGFKGELVLEISNNSSNPVSLEPGMRIAQLVFYRLGEKSSNPYNENDNRYQGQSGAVVSKMGE